MKIGLIAMSGVRAWSEEVNGAGLSMPGVLERGAVIASLPSLSLLTLAGMTDAKHEVSYHEIRDLRAEWAEAAEVGATGGGGGAEPLTRIAPARGRNNADGPLKTGGFDLVAISSMTAQVKDGYAVAD